MAQPAQHGPDKQGSAAKAQGFVRDLWGIRYQVADVAKSIDFYTNKLGFKLDNKNLPAFGQVSIGKLKLILSGPGASGSRRCRTGNRSRPAAGTAWCCGSRIWPTASRFWRRWASGSATAWKQDRAASSPCRRSGWQSDRTVRASALASRRKQRDFCLRECAVPFSPKIRIVPRSRVGPVAQWLEPAAHNGLVAGSSPAGPTNIRLRNRNV